jgi:RNA polymerase sigma factor (sigma-70 family)
MHEAAAIRVPAAPYLLHRDRNADAAALVAAAAEGDDEAWKALVARFTPTLRAVARGFRLGHADVDDVVQTTWLAAFRHIRRLRNPAAFPGWLAVTARRECLRTLQRAVWEVVSDDPPTQELPALDSPAALAIEADRRRAVRAAIGRLPGHQRRLLGALLAGGEPSYDHVSRVLRMPVGSIGPTRERALGRLRADSTLRAELGEDAA